MMLKAIIIDDELSCIETIKLMLEKKFAQQVALLEYTTSPLEGIKLIEQHHPDIVFIDVEMLQMTGIALLQSLDRIDFHVIFTTAHKHYAIQAIKLNALDYLTKPISLEELTIAIDKCGRKANHDIGNLNQSFQNIKENEVKKIAVLIGSVTQLVPINEIIRVESHSNYSIIHFSNRLKQTIAKTLKEMEELLTPHNFLRIHHSHLINPQHIIGFKNKDNGQVVMYGNVIIEVSRRKKKEVIQKLNIA